METETVAAALADDLLAAVLGLVPARSLAASRGVCKAWRDLIDERQMLVRLRRLLPHSVRGLFINYECYPRPQFLSRPTSTSSPEDDGPLRFDGKFDFIQLECPGGWYEVVDHCNGLVLVRESGEEVLHVCNPTTRWSARLPPWPRGVICHLSARDWALRAFLVFDPFVSPEYKVLLSPEMVPWSWMELKEKDDAWRLMEWPPSTWKVWHEFSSSTGRWQEKVFVRQGEAAGTAGDLLLYRGAAEPPYRYAPYWKGALYIHCPGEFVSRLSLLDDKYIVIKSPIKLADGWKITVPSFIGRSEKGVYFAAITTDALTKLLVWNLCESDNNQMEWLPKDQSNLKVNTYSWCLENNKFDEPKYWTALDLEPEYWKLHSYDGRKTQDATLEQNGCWNSDDDNIVEVSDDEQEIQTYVKFLGFHPYKEVAFLCSTDSVVAFHLNSPKVQYLGTVNQGKTCGHRIEDSFVYTPCLLEIN